MVGVLAFALATLLIPMSEAGAARGAYASRGMSLLIVGGFLVASIVAAVHRPDSIMWRLMAAVGCAWFLGSLVGADAPVLHTLGLLTAMLWTGPLVHLALGFPSGRLRSAGERLIVTAGYAVGTVLHIPPLLFAEHASVTCRHCEANLALVSAELRVAELLFELQFAIATVTLVAGCVVLRHRWRDATRPERRALAPVLWSGSATGVAAIVAIMAETSGQRQLAGEVDWMYLALFASIPFAFLAGLLRSQLHRAEAVSTLVKRLSEAPTPRNLRDTLADALRDPSLDIAYWLPDQQHYVDDQGRRLSMLLTADSKQITEINHQGRRIAAIIHDAALAEEPALVSAAGAAVAVGLERERLGAQLRAHVDELRSSRARIVHAADTERRRLERDLHDGAQQRLISLLLNLKLARRSDAAPTTMLDTVETELSRALEDLRRLAAGILPPILVDHGLQAAAEELAERSPIPVQLGEMPHQRLPSSVEIAAYFVISETLTNVTKHANASQARVSATASDHQLLIEVSDDGAGGACLDHGSGLKGLADRVGALGGHLDIHSPPGGGTTIHAAIPHDA